MKCTDPMSCETFSFWKYWCLRCVVRLRPTKSSVASCSGFDLILNCVTPHTTCCLYDRRTCGTYSALCAVDSSYNGGIQGWKNQGWGRSANNQAAAHTCVSNLFFDVDNTVQVHPKQLQELVHVRLATFFRRGEHCYLLAPSDACHQKATMKGRGKRALFSEPNSSYCSTKSPGTKGCFCCF